jgi:hypothetical protein
MSWRDDAAGTATALAGLAMFALAAPLLDTTEGDHFATPEDRATYRAEVGWPAEIPIAAAWVDRAGWDALGDSLEILEKPFAIRQYWKLYPIWSTNCRAIEVRVDGKVAYRTNDAAHDWLAPQLRERRIAYLSDSILKRDARRNTRELARWIALQARARDPEIHRVALIVEEGSFPCTNLTPAATVTTHAPDWKVSVDRLEER